MKDIVRISSLCQVQQSYSCLCSRSCLQCTCRMCEHNNMQRSASFSACKGQHKNECIIWMSPLDLASVLFLTEASDGHCTAASPSGQASVNDTRWRPCACFYGLLMQDVQKFQSCVSSFWPFPGSVTSWDIPVLQLQLQRITSGFTADV